MDKKTYIEEILAPAITNADYSVESLEYNVEADERETVKITYRNGYRKYVNVSCNSNIATAYAVIKKCLF